MVGSVIYKEVIFLLMWNTKRVSEYYFFIYKHLISLAIFIESAVLLLLYHVTLSKIKSSYVHGFLTVMLYYLSIQQYHTILATIHQVFSHYSSTMSWPFTFFMQISKSVFCVPKIKSCWNFDWRLHRIWIKLACG